MQQAAIRRIQGFDDEIAKHEERAEEHQERSKRAGAIGSRGANRQQLAEDEDRERSMEQSAIGKQQVDGLRGGREQRQSARSLPETFSRPLRPPLSSAVKWNAPPRTSVPISSTARIRAVSDGGTSVTLGRHPKTAAAA